LTISEALQGQASLQYAQAVQATSLGSGNTIKALELLPRGYHARWEAPTPRITTITLPNS
jgi:hypothetical protein